MLLLLLLLCVAVVVAEAAAISSLPSPFLHDLGPNTFLLGKRRKKEEATLKLTERGMKIEACDERGKEEEEAGCCLLHDVVQYILHTLGSLRRGRER